MEIEQNTSKFQPWLRNAFVSSDKAFGEFSRKLSQYAIPGDADFLFNKIFSRSYAWLDSLSGSESATSFGAQEHTLKAFQKTLGFLETQGVISGVRLDRPRYNDAPAFTELDIIPAYPLWTTDGRVLDKAFGHGFGKDVTAVFSKAIGEFLERYFLTLYRKKNLIRASSNSLARKGRSFLDPRLLSVPSEKQAELYPEQRWNEESVLSWEKAERVSTGDGEYVPAQLVYWNFILDNEEPRLAEFNTNGAGGMFTKEGAILSGLYELIQRDAFLIYWLNCIAPQRVDPETVPNDAFRSLYQESRRYGFAVYCLNITADTGVPSFVVAISDESGKSPRFSLGGGCQADPVKALHRALEEAWSAYYCVRPRPPYNLPESYQPFSDRTIGQGERLRLWANPQMAENFLFFLAGAKKHFSEFSFNFPDSFSSEKEELKFLTKKVEDLGRGYEVYYYLVRHPILSRLGYCSARVIVPQLISLYLNETRAPFDAKRLREVPHKLGLEAAKELCPYPHPFP